jgi:hypothetical protein
MVRIYEWQQNSANTDIPSYRKWRFLQFLYFFEDFAANAMIFNIVKNTLTTITPYKNPLNYLQHVSNERTEVNNVSFWQIAIIWLRVEVVEFHLF